MVSAEYSVGGPSFITWGMNQPATWAWWLRYVDEIHCPVWDTTLKLFPGALQQQVLNMMQEI